jgi:hypothetical protein
MPPPRLSRHLRPCHPPGTANQVRCAHKTARVTFLTDGDDFPPRSYAKSDDGDSNTPHDTSDRTTDASTQHSSWWGAALSSIASFGFKTASARSNAPTPETPATSTSQASQEKRGNTGQEAQEVKPGLIRKTKNSPERHLRQQQRLAARLERLKKENAENNDHSALAVRKLNRKEERRIAARLEQIGEENVEKDCSSSPPIRKLVTNVDTRRLRQLQSTSPGEEERRRSSATSGGSMQIRGTPSTATTFQGHDGAVVREPAAFQRDDNPTIQQQLQQLFEQVRSLQATLEGKLAAEQPPSTSAAGRTISTTESDMSHKTNQQAESETRPSIRKILGPEPLRPTQKPVAAAITDSQASREATKSRSGRKPFAARTTYEQIYSEARSAYRSSTDQLGKAAVALVDLPPRAVAPISSLVLQRFRALELEREAKLDKEVFNIAKRYKRALKSLADGLTQLPNADFVAPHVIVFGAAATPRLIDNSGNMVSTLLPGYRTDRSLQAAAKGYQTSTGALVKLANEFEDMRSHAISPILTRVRNRLREIAELGKLERDSDIARILGFYKHWRVLYAEVKYSPTVIKQPAVMLRLKTADANSRFNRLIKEAHALAKEISLITPSSPRMRIHRETTTVSRRLELDTDRPKVPGDKVLRSDKRRPQARVQAADAANVTVSKRIHIAERNKDSEASDPVADAVKTIDSMELYGADKKNDGQRLTRQIHTQSRSMKSSDGFKVYNEDGGNSTVKAREPSGSKDKMPPKPSPEAKSPSVTAAKLPPAPAPRNDGLSEQSLLEELFPEATSTPQPPHPEKRDQYPKLELPDSTPIIRRELVDGPRSAKEHVVDSFRSKGEQITVLQLTNCSTELTEADFRRLIPKGKHIEAWRRDGEFSKIIPGRDPLSLERMPFYYILFKDAESALTYQKNVSRLHKLSALHQPANIFSAIPPPKGFLEDGEDITALVQSYNLLPTHHPLSLNVLMQPYNPALRALIERGGYQPVAPNTASDGTRVWKVLLQIEGYEPTPSDLLKILSRDAYKHGMSLPLRNESHTSIHRLRDIINLKTSVKPISSASPRAYGTFSHLNPDETTYDDPAIQSMLAGAEEDNANALNQLVMNRVYNRWVLDFETEDEARRWCFRWHRRVLPELSHGKGSWREGEEVRVCNTEVLW